MKKAIYLIALAAWLFVGTLSLSRWWYANPDFFPKFPSFFWQTLDRLFEATNVDDASNVELFVVVLLAFLVVSAFTAAVIALWFRLNKVAR